LGGACSSNPVNHGLDVKIVLFCLTINLRRTFFNIYTPIPLPKLVPSHSLHPPLLPAFRSQSFDSFVFDAAHITCLSFPGTVRQTAVRDRNKKREKARK